MLRGAQTVGELRGRTERMHPFSDLEEVERVLDSLAGRMPDPLVAPVGRGRWMHLLGGADAAATADAEMGEPRVPQSNLEERLASLEREVADLRQQLESLRRQFE